MLKYLYMNKRVIISLIVVLAVLIFTFLGYAFGRIIKTKEVLREKAIAEAEKREREWKMI